MKKVEPPAEVVAQIIGAILLHEAPAMERDSLDRTVTGPKKDTLQEVLFPSKFTGQHDVERPSFPISQENLALIASKSDPKIAEKINRLRSNPPPFYKLFPNILGNHKKTMVVWYQLRHLTETAEPTQLKLRNALLNHPKFDSMLWQTLYTNSVSKQERTQLEQSRKAPVRIRVEHSTLNQRMRWAEDPEIDDDLFQEIAQQLTELEPKIINTLLRNPKFNTDTWETLYKKNHSEDVGDLLERSSKAPDYYRAKHASAEQCLEWTKSPDIKPELLKEIIRQRADNDPKIRETILRNPNIDIDTKWGISSHVERLDMIQKETDVKALEYYARAIGQMGNNDLREAIRGNLNKSHTVTAILGGWI